MTHPTDQEQDFWEQHRKTMARLDREYEVTDIIALVGFALVIFGLVIGPAICVAWSAL